MLKITAIGNLTNDVTLRTSESGKPVAILRIASPLPRPERQPAHRLHLHQGAGSVGRTLCADGIQRL